MDKRDIYLEALNFRHACKLFDESKKISNDDIKYILQATHLSPTSFGMQGVRLTVITNSELKEALRPYCWNQPQITTCSHLVVFKTRTKDLKPDSSWVQQRFLERDLPKEAFKRYLEVYKNFHENLKCKDIYEWGARQAYIYLSTMLNSAALLGIDSCPIEGFEKERVEEILNIDTTQEEVVVLCALGYRVNPQPKRRRIPLNELVEFLS